MTLHSSSLGEGDEQNWPDSEEPDRSRRENTEVRADRCNLAFVSVFSQVAFFYGF